jgi:hypothetical protein
MVLRRGHDLPFFTKHEDAFKVSACLQMPILLLASIVLDGGEVLQWMMLAALTYWLGVFIIMIRRNGNATRLDALLIKWGYPLAIVLAAILLGVVPMGMLRDR